MIAKRFAVALLMTLALCACQDKDTKMVLKTLNEDPRLLNRSVHVEKVAFERGRNGSARPYDADILDKQGKVIAWVYDVWTPSHVVRARVKSGLLAAALQR